MNRDGLDALGASNPNRPTDMEHTKSTLSFRHTLSYAVLQQVLLGVGYDSRRERVLGDLGDLVRYLPTSGKCETKYTVHFNPFEGMVVRTHDVDLDSRVWSLNRRLEHPLPQISIHWPLVEGFTPALPRQPSMEHGVFHKVIFHETFNRSIEGSRHRSPECSSRCPFLRRYKSALVGSHTEERTDSTGVDVVGRWQGCVRRTDGTGEQILVFDEHSLPSNLSCATDPRSLHTATVRVRAAITRVLVNSVAEPERSPIAAS